MAQADISSHILVAVPGWASAGKSRGGKSDPAKDEADRRLTRRALDMAVTKLADVADFPVPALRVGTLDRLMVLVDELSKIDSTVEGVVKKLDRSYKELKGSDARLEIDGQTPAQFLEHFTWAEQKYPVRASLEEILQRLQDDVSNCEEELRRRFARFSEVTQALLNIERKDGGTLVAKNLAGIVKESDIVEGEYLTTLLVVVPKSKGKDFDSTYETIEDADSPDSTGKHANAEPAPAAAAPAEQETEEEKRDRERNERRARSAKNTRSVVPGSARKLAEDEEFSLFRVVMLRKGADAFRAACRERRWTVRPFVPAQADDNSQAQRVQLSEEKGRLLVSLIRWCDTTFVDVFTAWVHVKAVRVFVESVLRFGIPVNFQAVVLRPRKGYRTKLRSTLQDLYGWLSGSSDTGAVSADDKAAEAAAGGEFYPYVSLQLDLTELS